MWKKHHIAILVIAGIGVLYLIYEWYTNSVASASSDSTGSIDTSQLPTVISTGGGAVLPSSPTFGVQSFDQSAQPVAPVSSPTDTSAIPATVNVMPNASQSGVPTNSDAAQEFNTNQAIAAPSQATSTPSFYASAATLPYINVSQATVQVQPFGDPNATPTTRGTLLSFLQGDVKAYETDPNETLTAAQVQTNLQGEMTGYCGLPGNDCSTGNPISDLVSQYSSFLTAKNSLNNPTLPTTTTTAPPVAPPVLQSTRSSQQTKALNSSTPRTV